MANTFIPTDNKRLETSPTPRRETIPEPGPWWEGPALQGSSIPTTSVEQVKRNAEILAGQHRDKADEIPLDDIEDEDETFSAAMDAAVNEMHFYNGRTFSEGRKLHNQARIARGLAPIPEGKA